MKKVKEDLQVRGSGCNKPLGVERQDLKRIFVEVAPLAHSKCMTIKFSCQPCVVGATVILIFQVRKYP